MDFTEKANKWLKRIFSVSTLTTISTVIAACIAIIQYVESNGGSFIAFINNEEAISPCKNTILVYLDKDSADLSQIGIFPKISNPTKYSLQDVLLTYRIDSKSTNISYTDYFSVHRVANGEQITNNDKTLYAKTEMPEPFYYFIVKDKGEASIDIRATYRGVDEPFSYQADIFARKLYKEDCDSRRKAVFKDAFRFASSRNFNKVDLIILDNDSIESYKNLSQNELSEENSSLPPDAAVETNLDKQTATTKSGSGIKTVSDIKTQNEELVKLSQENQGTPWYMYIVGGVFVILLFVGILTDIFVIAIFDDLGRADRIKASIAFISATLVLYLSIYYGLSIFSEAPIQRFWLGLINTYLITLSFGLACFISIKTKMYLNVSDDNDDWIFFIYMILVFAPAIYLCYYLSDIIQI